MYTPFLSHSSEYLFMLRYVILLVSIIIVAFWFPTQKIFRKYWLFTIAPISYSLHAFGFTLIVILNSLQYLSIDAHVINDWNALVRIHEGVTIILLSLAMSSIIQTEGKQNGFHRS
jgi:peptidoglycan/LPS O-acetylase OafA/YrhL